MENEVAKVCVWRECRNESSTGQQAVIHVINNRAKKQNKSYYEIVTASMQFSSMTYKADPQLSLYPNLHDVPFLNICHWMDIIFLDAVIYLILQAEQHFIAIQKPQLQFGSTTLSGTANL